LRKILFSVSLLSAAIIAFQLALMQVLSMVQWHHFAYMIISVAMLGFGAAGSVLAIFRKPLVRHAHWLLPALMMGSGLAMSLVTGLSQLPALRFDSYLLFAEFSQTGNLLLSYLIFMLPFFLAALSLGLIFLIHVKEIGRVYFADLLGSAAGGLFVLLIISLFFPNQLPALIAVLPIVAGSLLITRSNRLIQFGIALISIIIISWKIYQPPRLVLSQYKDLSKTLLLPEASIAWEKTSPYGVLQGVTSPALRYAPGLSLTATAAAEVHSAVFLNGNWFGVLLHPDTPMVLDYTSLALPYIMRKRKEVLILHAGTGIDAAHALSQGASKITAVEPNAALISKMKEGNAHPAFAIWHDPSVSMHPLEPRSFIMKDTGRYDLIVLPMVGSFGGSAGLFALQEQFSLTREAFREMWSRLRPGGAISVTAWMDYPVRSPLKILATMMEVLEAEGIKEPARHMVAIRSWGTISFAITRSAISDTEIRKIRSFCEERLFDPAVLPGLDTSERARYHQFEDGIFFSYLEQIMSGKEREKLYDEYAFNIRPSTDNKPYFSQFLKMNRLGSLSGSFNIRSIPFIELGYLVLVATLAQVLLLSFTLILLPLFRVGWKAPGKFSTFLYFSGIGLGYMFVEMMFIQRFILYFGSPVYSASAVITTMLFFSGVGSYASGYFQKTRMRLFFVFAGIIVLLLLYSFLLTPIMQQTASYSLVFKIFLLLLLVAPPAFLMGIPFPSGLLMVSRIHEAHIPWAWGINGCTSVISTALATMVSVELGFSSVMIIAAIAYCLPLMGAKSIVNSF
jgi:SAM-dependent methyltransferase